MLVKGATGGSSTLVTCLALRPAWRLLEWALAWCPRWGHMYTVGYRCNMVKLLQNSHNRHSTAWRWDVACLLWVQTLILCLALITTVLYAIPCHIWPCYNGTRLYVCIYNNNNLMQHYHGFSVTGLHVDVLLQDCCISTDQCWRYCSTTLNHQCII